MQRNRIRRVGEKLIGDGQPVFVIAEIGINHNGSVETAKRMIEGAKFAGCDAIKFQKRTPELCVPRDQWEIERDTPWGRMTYIDYRHRMEFSRESFGELVEFCMQKEIIWFASCWDVEAVDFVEDFDPVVYKIASASLTDYELLVKHRNLNKPIMLSTGMSTMSEINSAIEVLGQEKVLLAHATSAYPCKLEELNLNIIRTFRRRYPDMPIGYSGHEVGLSPTWAAIALGASFVERHITLDRAMWGSDQAASVEIGGFMKLVANIRDIEKALGDGEKRVYESEMSQMKKLRKVHSLAPVLERTGKF